MDEKDKDLITDPENTDQNVSDSKNDSADNTDQAKSKTKYEENDGWQFEAQAPTLDDTKIEGDGFEIEVPDVKKVTVKKQKAAGSEDSAVAPAAAKPVDYSRLKAACLSLFLIAVIAVLAVLGVRYYTVPNGKEGELSNPGNVALTVGDTNVSIGMYNYYYSCIVNNYQQYSSYYGNLDTSVDYNKQFTTDDDGNKITWADKFKSDTIKQIQYITAYYEAACNAGVTLTDTQKKTINSQMESLESSAKESGESANSYIAATYGDYCSTDTLRLMLEQCYVAENYYQQYNIESNVTDDEFTKYFNENKNDYLNCGYAFIEMAYDATNDDTKAAAVAKAQDYLKSIKTVDDMKKMIPTVCAEMISQYVDYGYFKNADEAVENLAEYVEDSMPAKDNNYGEDITKWIFSSDTAVGSTNYYVDEDNGLIYLILKTEQPKLDETVVYSVRHILIKPDDGKDDADESTDTETEKTYTDEQWAAAEKKANDMLAKWEKGEKTEYTFAEFAESDSDDTESTSSGSSGLYGGLYDGVGKGEMVSEFENWALDSSRKYGDTGIVKSKYGYHIMYFVDASPTYEHECKKDIKANTEDEFVDKTVIKEHKSAMSKTKVAVPTKSDE